MRGHIVKRGKNSYTVVVSLGRDPETGKRKQHWQSVKGTKKDAERVLAEIQHNVNIGGFIRHSKMTVGEFLEQWLRDYAAVNTAPRTYERYQEIVRLHFIPALGSLPLVNLQPQHIQAYYAKALQSGRRNGKGGLAAITVYKHHRILFEALKYAVKQELLVRNVAVAIEPPRPKHREMTPLNPDEVRIFLNAAHETPYFSLFYTAIYTGLRRSELLGLRWCDIDLDLATLSVVQSMHQLRNGQYIVGQPKTKKGRRLVSLTPSSASVLRSHEANQQATRNLLGTPLLPTDSVFSYPDGRPLVPNSVSEAFQNLAKSVGITGRRFHDLRHTHATLMLRQGIHPKIVSERLGHSTVATTLDVYSHVLPGLQEAAARRFDEGLLQGTSTELPVASG